MFRSEDNILRQVNFRYKEHYDLLMQSGLYTSLVDSKLLIPHDEVNNEYRQSDDGNADNGRMTCNFVHKIS